ncbi:helix-turn-helix transcriptional regulator [Subtercola sp. YIM 133946]|uniref:helix-turn-helix transcriptional regulator n=1 Tax=Subtercola sp. YIM 133946 TaxID=3118909 RepID=UPI002F93106A
MEFDAGHAARVIPAAAQPAQPPQPAQPVQTQQCADSTQPAHPEQPVQTKKRADPTQLAQSEQPVHPVQPVPPDTHGELAALLRSWRDRLSPVDVGYPAGDSRRATGLRREELAALAGLSVDYVVRLEQGRARRPSAQVASALARALQLSDTERDHLYLVAGLLPPTPAEVPTHIPPGVQRLMARLGEIPLAVFTASWDLITCSPLWIALLGRPVQPAAGRPNLIRSLFTDSALHDGEGHIVSRSGSVDAFGASLVSDLRRVHGRYPLDRGVNALIAELLVSSDVFRALWQSGTVGEHQSERKVVHSEVVGDLELDCDVFTVAGTDLRVVAYTAATGSAAAEKLDFLRVSAVTGGHPGPLAAHPSR